MSSATEKIEAFFQDFPARKYRKGQVLILNGDEPSKIYYLMQGTVKQYDVSYRGEEIVLNLFKPGAFFPMSHALNGGTSPYIYEAAEDIELKICPADQVITFVREHPDILLDLLSRVYRGTDALLGRIVQLMDGSARTRLLYELIIAAKRFGSTEDDERYILDISEKELAARAGLSRETISREISKLKERGLAELKDGRITIPSLSALEARIE